ncbi:uncharacterized protein METZ01_LOCUS329823, partial [marine metagenome]
EYLLDMQGVGGSKPPVPISLQEFTFREVCFSSPIQVLITFGCLTFRDIGHLNN